LLTAKSCNYLQRPWSLREKWAALPKSIQDAIKLCGSLKLKHLWVDSLCIVQDDGPQKKAQIANMHAIYHNACVTIVAAAGGDANSGLPFLETDNFNSPEHLCLNGFHLYDWQIDWRDNSPKRPRWSTRGWTLQEGILSQRKIVCTDDRVFCSDDLESFVWDHLSQRLAKINELEDDYNRAIWFSPEKSTISMKDPPCAIYFHYLHNYVHRELSHEKDNINAFTGILNILEPLLGQYWFGLVWYAFKSICLVSFI
jgi:hypothetical protein